MHFHLELVIIVKVFRGVAQVVERYFREVEAASSSLVTPIHKTSVITTKVVTGVFDIVLFLVGTSY